MTTTGEVGRETLARGLYRHVKTGGLYTVLGLVRHHETGLSMVLYYSHRHQSVNTRPLRGFDFFDGSRDPDGFLGFGMASELRFEFIVDTTSGAPWPTDPIDVTEAVLLMSDTLVRNYRRFEATLEHVGRIIEAHKLEVSANEGGERPSGMTPERFAEIAERVRRHPHPYQEFPCAPVVYEDRIALFEYIEELLACFNAFASERPRIFCAECLRPFRMPESKWRELIAKLTDKMSDVGAASAETADPSLERH